MGSLFDILYDILFQPKIAMRTIAERKNVGQSIIVFLLSILIPLWALYFGLKASGMSTMIHGILGLKVVGSILMWVMGAAMWHLIAELFSGKGTAVGLFAALGFAHFPRIFIVPLWVVATLMPPSIKATLMAIAVLAVMFWSLTLDVIAIREVHQLSTAKAVLVIITPILVMMMLCAIAFAFIGSAITQMPMWL